MPVRAEPVLADTAAAIESELLTRARNGDSEAFAELARRHYQSCHRTAVSILRNPADAEDEVQNTFLKALIHLPGYENRSELRTWLTSIVRNQCLMRLRSAAHQRSRPLDGVSGIELRHSPTAEEELSRRQLERLVARNVRLLPAVYREVLLLHNLRGMRLDAIARRLGISPGAVKSRLRRARNELRNRIINAVPALR
jgi:RNA polymerase sigma-70 factor (ECF subfamily)